MVSSSSCLSLLFLLSVLFFFPLSSSEQRPFKVLGFGNLVVYFHPAPLVGHSPQGAKDIVSCERVHVAGFSRFNLSRYANSFWVSLKPSNPLPESLSSKIVVCFHRNASTALCQCAKDEWETIQMGPWSMSPYGDRYIDVMSTDGLSGSVTISLEEEFQRWRLFCLGFGFVLLLLAPLISSWVPFYYSSSMVLAVLLVVLVILFQGMKLLPTGRKNVFYLTIYGSVLGAGSFLAQYFSVLFNSILVNFGLREDKHYPVAVFVLLGIFLAGAALGYWMVRKFVLTEDGSVDAGVAQFVKWAMRIVAIVSIFQSTLDTLLGITALCTCWGGCFLLSSKRCQGRTSKQLVYPKKGNLWQQKAKETRANHVRAEFLSRSPKTGTWSTGWESPKSPYAWSESPTKGLIMSSPHKMKVDQQDYYSTFHKTPSRKRFSKKEWEDFTHESTKQAIAEWVSSPEFTDWIIEHADRIQVLPDESSDDSMASGSDSSEETVAEDTGSGLSFFKWC